ncbi:hypothetical protein [Pseudomonas sp. UMAB-40]|uniref:hypothetical protein n=1 Tax=Pseudomonas sp. UMAB-40 TaxID=1365407 RepID=UPI001C58F807|nr:hypothetical protein [Pseudomonas sp. UMAB-40]
MNNQPDTPDLSGLLPTVEVETLDQARANTIAKVMASQQALSEQFSKIDHPFVTDDAKDDYELATDEFRALINCSVHMPQSVEGIRFLERWHKSRMDQIELLLEHAKPGTLLEIGAGNGATPMSADFARGMRAGLLVVRAMFDTFPLELSVGEEPEEEPPE